MPEKPEVVTVAKKLKLRLVNKKIMKVQVLWDNIIEGISVSDFETKLVGEEILDITTRGKWIVLHLVDFLLLIHLRMEGKFFFRTEKDPIGKHEHVIFTLDSGEQVRFHDVRKFGKMRILSNENPEGQEPFLSLGFEPWDENLTPEYLLERYKRKSLPIKSALLDQTIITGIGNIYADEILFMSMLHPLTPSCKLTGEDCKKIISNTKKVLGKAILEGGTTIRNYTSEEGVTGLFQNHLLVHMQENNPCSKCGSKIVRIKVGGRSTYYCPKCQKMIKLVNAGGNEYEEKGLS